MAKQIFYFDPVQDQLITLNDPKRKILNFEGVQTIIQSHKELTDYLIGDLKQAESSNNEQEAQNILFFIENYLDSFMNNEVNNLERTSQNCNTDDMKTY